MKVYGTEICIDCRNYKAIQKARGFEAEFISITSDTASLKEFLAMRNNEPVFDEIKTKGEIGIPFFVNDDGRKTLDINEALNWIGQEPLEVDKI